MRENSPGSSAAGGAEPSGPEPNNFENSLAPDAATGGMTGDAAAGGMTGGGAGGREDAAG
jgi:hypothetical protein